MRGCVNTLSNLSRSSHPPFLPCFCPLQFVCARRKMKRGEIVRESPRAAERTEEPRLEDSFKNSMIKGGERVTVWLRIVGHADLSSNQSRLVCRPLSFGGAVLTLSPRGVLLVMGSTRSDRCWISVERDFLLQSSEAQTEERTPKAGNSG